MFNMARNMDTCTQFFMPPHLAKASDPTSLMLSCKHRALLRAEDIARTLWRLEAEFSEACALVDHARVARQAIFAVGARALGASEEQPASCVSLAT